MDLRQFTAASIEQIVLGVSDAAQSLSDLNARVNPQVMSTADDLYHQGTGTKAQMLEFDVAVTVGSSSNVGGGGGIGISVFSAKIDGSSREESSYVSRVRYSVPVVFPPDSRPSK